MRLGWRTQGRGEANYLCLWEKGDFLVLVPVAGQDEST